LLNPDLIEEFQSASSNYSAAQGQAGGAQINLVTKSGTNIFHGSAYGFVRDDRFDAKNYFETVTAPYDHQQFGATFGGPIIRNTLFFYGGYEGLRIEQARTQRFTVPTSKQRQGDFSEDPPIFDPGTYDPVTGTRQPFPGNVIPPDRISPEAAKALELLFPVPNQPGRVNNLEGAKPDSQDTDQVTGRVDYTPAAGDTLFGRYIYYNPRKIHGGFAALPNFADQQDTPAHNGAVGYTRALSARLLSQSRVGYNRVTQQGQGVPIN
jgi:hypothetical protein